MQTALWVWARDAGRRRSCSSTRTRRASRRRALAARRDPRADARRGPPGRDRTSRVRSSSRCSTTGELVDVGEVEYGDDAHRASIFSMKAFPLAGRRVAVTFENVTEIGRARAARCRRARRASAARSTRRRVGMALTEPRRRVRPGERAPRRDARLHRRGADGARRPRRHAIRTTSSVDVEYVGGDARRRDATRIEREKRYIRKDGAILWAELTVVARARLRRRADARRRARPGHHGSSARRTSSSRRCSSGRSCRSSIADDDRRIVDLNDAARRAPRRRRAKRRSALTHRRPAARASRSATSGTASCARARWRRR